MLGKVLAMLGEVPKIDVKICLFATLVIAAFSACAKEKKSDLPPMPALEERPTGLSGSLVKSVTEVQSSEYREFCDEKFPAAQLEVAQVLDGRAAEIEAFSRKNANPTAQYRRVSLGPIMVRELVTPVSPVPGWQSYSTSWKEALEDFARIKHQPISNQWVQLNSDVRSLISEDMNRAVYFFNPYLDKDAGPRLERLARLVENCLAKEGCESINVVGDLELFLSGQPNYRAYLRLAANKRTGAEKRQTLEGLLRYLRGDLKQFLFRPNTKMGRVSAGRYELQMDPGPLASVADQLSRYVESVWRGTENQVSIKWKDARTASDLYRVVLGATVGERAYVSRENKSVNLFPDMRAKSIAHEFGHVMGFTDRYFTVWHPESCEYRIQSSQEDLMSDPTYGVVLKEHWDELSRYY